MGIAQCAETAKERTVIVSLDKDLLMIPGLHYSWHIEGGPATNRWVREAREVEISDIEGLKYFYTQLLVGDPSDNLKGVPGIGKVKASKMLAGDLTEEEMFTIVRDAYPSMEAMLLNGQCLWIQRQPNQIWEFPFESNYSGE